MKFGHWFFVLPIEDWVFSVKEAGMFCTFEETPIVHCHYSFKPR